MIKDEALKPAPVEPDWKAEYLKSVESGCITLDELREARAELDATNRQVEILSDALAESQRQRQSAQRQWVGLTDYEIGVCSTEAAMNRSEMVGGAVTFARAIEAKLRSKNAAAQPAVPDALTSADIQEHIEYVTGWNECRAAMLEILKARGNT
jgi:hypothetical protein